jgi:hypothetical protein
MPAEGRNEEGRHQEDMPSEARSFDGLAKGTITCH